MATARYRRLIVALLILVIWPLGAAPQEPLWKGHMAAGQSAFEQRDLTAARDQFEAALVAAEDFPEDDPRIGLTLNNLATVYNFQGEFAKAEPLLLRAREIWKQAPPPGDLHLATTLHNLAGLYFSQGRFEEVEPLLKQALAIRERSLPADHPALAKTRESMATLRQAFGQLAEANLDPDRSGASRTRSIVVHLASLRTVEAAKQEWEAIKEDHPDLVQGLDLKVVRVNLGARGIFQRLLAGPLPDRGSATALCSKFKAKDQYCAVVER